MGGCSAMVVPAAPVATAARGRGGAGGDAGDSGEGGFGGPGLAGGLFGNPGNGGVGGGRRIRVTAQRIWGLPSDFLPGCRWETVAACGTMYREFGVEKSLGRHHSSAGHCGAAVRGVGRRCCIATIRERAGRRIRVTAQRIWGLPSDFLPGCRWETVAACGTMGLNGGDGSDGGNGGTGGNGGRGGLVGWQRRGRRGRRRRRRRW